MSSSADLLMDAPGERLIGSKDSAFARCALGTAQLGMRYGIANQTGQPDGEQALDLVRAACQAGLNWFDTAAGYGDSEAVLGRIFGELGIHDDLNVVSKGSLAKGGPALTTVVSGSLERLRVARLTAWLLHDENQLSSWDDRVRAEASVLCAENRVGSFGVSVYHPAAAVRGVEECGLTSVQFPASPLDRRFLRGGVAERLARNGARLYVRSVYLQGLCLMEPSLVPERIFRGREAVKTLSDFCVHHGFDRDHFCLHYVLQRTAAVGARLVIGLESRQQLARNAFLLSAPPIPTACLDEWDARWPDDLDDLILPFRWNTPS